MRYLDLRYSNLKDVHAAESIHQLYNLQTLNLHQSKNVKNILKEGIGSLINLRHLDLSSSDAKVLPNSIAMLSNLQILNIKYSDISSLPTNIGCLHNLSSLDISYTKISELPDSISLLNNLRKFNFKFCYQLEALPGNFGTLTQLTSLDLSDTSIKELPESLTSNICKLEYVNLGKECKFPEDIKNWVELRRLVSDEYYWSMTKENLIMPRGIEKLSRLEVLEPYVVRKEDNASIDTSCSTYSSSSSSIHELADLNSLWRLRIENLENVRGGKIEAETAKLKDKQNIQHLYLQWKTFKEEEEEELVVVVDEWTANNSVMVLEGLQPHPNLVILNINGFPGLTSPKWMGSSSCLPNLVELTFDGCKNCTELVGLGQLPCLQFLRIRGINSIKCLGKEFYYQQQEETEGSAIAASTTTTAKTLFPSLTELCIQDLENVEEWSAPLPPDNSFPCLEAVEINRCPNLTSIPDLRLWTSSLTHLAIKNCKKLEKELKAYDLDKLLPSTRFYWNDDFSDKLVCWSIYQPTTPTGFKLYLMDK